MVGSEAPFIMRQAPSKSVTPPHHARSVLIVDSSLDFRLDEARTEAAKEVLPEGLPRYHMDGGSPVEARHV